MKSLEINNFKSEKGITVVELLLALTVSTIVLAIIFPIFTNGIKNYQAVNSEIALRNEADYIVGTILNEIYLFYPDTVKQEIDENKITLRRSFITTADGKRRFIVNDGILNIPSGYTTEKLEFEIKDNNFYIVRDDTYTKVNSDKINILTDSVEGYMSTIKLLDCPTERACKNGTLQIIFALDFVDTENNRNQPLMLESTFGF